MLRFAFFIGLGILAGGGVVALTAPPGTGAWFLPVGLIVTIMSGVFISIGRTTRTIASPNASLVAAARSAQRIGLARVESVSMTGTRINEVPVCDIDLTVKPLHGPAYVTRSRMLLPPVQMVRFSPGSEIPVAILAEGEPDVAPIDDADERLLARVSLPRSGEGLPVRNPAPGALRADGTRAKPLISMNPATRWARVPLFLLVFVLAAAAVVYPHRAAALQSLDALVQDGRLHADLRDPDVIDDAIADLREAVGHTSVVEARVSEDSIWFVVPLTEGGLEADDWWYRRATLERYGAASVQPEDERQQFDLTEVAWERLPALIDEAVAEARITGDPDINVTVSRDYSDADTDSDDYMLPIGDIEITISMSDEYHSYTFIADADGENLTALQ